MTQFVDFVALGWVEKNLREEMETARTSLHRFQREPEQSQHLLAARQHVHSATGALRLCALEPAALLSEEMEHVLGLLGDDTLNIEEQKAAMTDLVAAIEALPAYLASVRSKREITPAGIANVVNDLRKAGNRPPLPDSLFFNPPLPDHAGISSDGTPGSEAEIKAFSASAMRVCQEHSKGALKANVAALKALRAMSDDAIRIFAGSQLERYFRCYGALLELLATNKVTPDEVVVANLKHCLTTLRSIAADGYRAFENPSADVCSKRALYYIGKNTKPSKTQKALLASCGIDDVDKYTAADEGRMIQEDDLLDALQQTMQQLVEVMTFLTSTHETISADNATLVDKIVPGLQQVSLQLHVVGLPQQAAIVNEQYKVLREHSRNTIPAAQADLVDFGGALSSVRDMLEFKLKYGLSAEGDTAALELNSAITEQVARCLREMKSGISREFVRKDLAELASLAPEKLKITIGGLRPLFRAAKLLGDDNLLDAVERWEEDKYPAPKTLLNIAKKLLSQFDDEDFTTQATAELDQVQSVLGMLEDRQRECDVVLECYRYLSASIKMGGIVNDTSMQCFAETIAALEQYMEARVADPAAKPNEHLVRAEKSAAKLQSHISQRANKMNPEGNILDFSTQSNAAENSNQKDAITELDSAAAADLEAALKPAQSKSDSSAQESQPQATETAAPAAVATAGDMPWREAMTAWQNASITRAPMPPVEGPDAEIDGELLECLVEECDEYLQKLQNAAPRLVATPTDKSVISEIRVVFHTVKGSAKTIGLAAFGEFMHDMEILFNALRDGYIEGSNELAEFLTGVVARFPSVVETIGQRIDLQGDDFQIPSTIANAMAKKKFTDDLTVTVSGLETTGGTQEAAPAEEPSQSKAEPLPYSAAIWSDQPADLIIASACTQIAEVAANEDSTIREQATRLIQSTLPALIELRDASLLEVGTENLAYLLDLERLEHLASGAIYGLTEGTNGKQSKVSISEGSMQTLEAYLNDVQRSEALAAIHRSAQYLLSPALGLQEPEHSEEHAPGSQAVPDNVVDFKGQAEENEQYQVEDIDEELLDLFIETMDEYTESIDESMVGLAAGDETSLRGLKNSLHTVKGAANSVGLRNLGAMVHEFESKIIDLELDGSICSEASISQIYSLISEFTDATRFVRKHKADWDENAVVVEEETSEETSVAPATIVEHPEEVAATKASETLRVDTHRVDRLLDMGLEISMSNVRCRQALDSAAQDRAEVQGLARRVLTLVDKLSLQLDTEIQAKTEAVPDGGQFDPLEMDRMTEKQGLAAILREAAYDLEEESRGMGRQLDNAVREAQSSSRLLQTNQSDLRQLRLVNFSKLGPGFRRLVHQVSRQLGKQVEFDFNAGKGGLDIRVFEQIRTALEHMLRNAIDHGIGNPEERRTQGKAEQGNIKLTITREGSEFVIRLLDDGSGLDTDKLRAQARKVGLLKKQDQLSDADALRLIMQPGFSTAKEVTEVSGRGVGMDVVYQSITQAGGTVEIQSKAGFYTQFDVRIPASIMVNEALLATVKEEQLAIPLTSLKGSEFYRRDEIFAQASSKEGRLEFRGEQYEVRYLGAVRGTAVTPELDEMPDFVPVLFAQHNRRRVAFFADGLDNAEDMVIRSLGAQYTGVPGIAGGAVKSDGQPVLALDLNEFIGQVGHADKLAASTDTSRDESTLVLCVDDSVMMRRTYEKRLESLGYTVITAVDGEDALDYLSQATRLPDFIFTDLEMPNMNGFEFIRNLRMAPNMADIPTIVVSSRDADKHRAEAQRVGASGFMAKGSNSAEGMQVVIERHLGNTPTAMVS